MLLTRVVLNQVLNSCTEATAYLISHMHHSKLFETYPWAMEHHTRMVLSHHLRTMQSILSFSRESNLPFPTSIVYFMDSKAPTADSTAAKQK